MMTTTRSPAQGTLYGIGIGPGDPELMTLKGVRLLRECNLIAYPAPVARDSMALSIARAHITSDKPLLRMDIPMVRDSAVLQKAYDTAAEQLRKNLAEGLNVACLCEGDPMFYGSFMYLQARLQRDCNVQSVPGVSSVMAGASALGRPITQHDQHLQVIPATLPEDRLRALLANVEAGVIMKIGRHFDKIHRLLQELGYIQRCDYIAYATLPQQMTMPLSAAQSQLAPYFSMIYIHAEPLHSG